ncbi:uL30 family ribosomal protein [Candidatus Woesearchaeota archaeon]|nr:uL30 family ribosomal protein [Candidatus Woesearchaeota archaeon]
MESKNSRIAAIRLRGRTQIKTKIEDTLKMLKLYKNNYCVVLQNTPNYIGMLKKSKDYLTWGEINDETFNILLDTRGEEFKGIEASPKNNQKHSKYFAHNNKKYKKYFRLSPPRKGLGRKGLKQSFNEGGALGYRGSKINELIKRMA